MRKKRIINKCLHDQEQEWAQARDWYRASDKGDVAWFINQIGKNKGDREALAEMNDAEIDVLCRLAMLALVEVIYKSDLEEPIP